jgi:hypothetical protein
MVKLPRGNGIANGIEIAGTRCRHFSGTKGGPARLTSCWKRPVLDIDVRRASCYFAMLHRRPVALVLLAFLVLFAQGRAAVHELSHLSEPLSAPGQPGKHLPHSPVCEQCVAFAQLGGALPSVPLVIEPQRAVPVPVLPTAPRAICRICRPYSSRAPPPLA